VPQDRDIDSGIRGFVAALTGIIPPALPIFHGFTQVATPFSKSAMIALVTLVYRSLTFIHSSSRLPPPTIQGREREEQGSA
jgi:hypothetical protein